MKYLQTKYLKTPLGLLITASLGLYLTVAIISFIPQGQSSNSKECFISLFDSQYDLSDFQNEHSGGNIFNCGEDNTKLFEDEHSNKIDQYLKILEPYKI